MKKCVKCEVAKNDSEFYFSIRSNGKKQLSSRCKVCYGKKERCCVVCGDIFIGSVNRKCCSKKCLKILRPQTFKNCVYCGKKFGPLSRLDMKFCSKSCMYLGRGYGGKKGKHYPHLQRARTGYCLICGKKYKAIHDYTGCKQKYCSEKCYQVAWKKDVRPKIILPAVPKGENNKLWKGDRVTYCGLHKWISNNLGRPNKCDMCGTTESKKFEWANKDHKYKRNTNDWQRLCTKCHRKWDSEYNKPAILRVKK